MDARQQFPIDGRRMLSLALMLSASMVALSGCDSAGDAYNLASDAPAECVTNIAQKSDGKAKTGYVQDIKQAAVTNDAFLRVVYTGKNIQLVLMTVPPGQHIGAEIHADHDQFYRIHEGHGEVQINGVRTPISDTSGIIVPAGALHNIVNTGDRPLRLHALYAPPKHQMNTVRNSKADADAAAEHFDGCVTE